MDIVFEHGTGPEAVYVYWLPSQQTDSFWPCKIGKAKNPKARISSQLAAMQEAPRVEIFWTDDSFWVERRVHQEMAKCRINPKREWFMTNPLIVREVVFATSFGERKSKPVVGILRNERIKQKKTQSELSAALSVHQSTISDIENGKVDPLISTLEKIANELGLRLTLERINT